MKSYIKRKPKSVSMITVAVIVIGLFSACSSSKGGGNSAGNAATGAGQNQTVEINQTNAKETPKKKESDIFSSFKKGADYKVAIRPNIIKDGWQPARTEDGTKSCESSGMPICDEYPELDAGPASGLGNIVFRWKKGDKVLLVYTVDDPPIYESYELEKPAKQSNETKVNGKYVHHYTEDYGGDISFVFKDKNKLDYEWIQEDVTWKGDGTWVWNEGKQTLTATVYTEPDVETSAESENTPPRKEIFVFQKDGNNLKLTAVPSGMSVYKGKVFQKR
jgi:hypothetical protein